MQTGSKPTAELVYPAIGAIVAAARRATHSVLPPYITLTSPLGRFSEAGFLGNGSKTFAPGGDPNNANFRVQGLVPPRGMTEQRINERRGLLKSVDALAAQAGKQEVYREMDEFQQKAYGLILGDARKAFDLSQEKDAMRDRYGRNQFGQSCLLARRLVEAGVPFITINDGGWDTHKNNFEAMRRKLPVQDQAISALLEDLAQRGLLHENGRHRGTASSDGLRAWPTRRRGSAAAITGAARFRPSSQAADSRADKCSVPPMRAARRSATVRSIRGTCPPASTSCSASIPTAGCRTRKAAWRTSVRKPSSLLTEIM